MDDDIGKDDEDAGCCAVDSVQKRKKRFALSVNRTATTSESVAALGCTARIDRDSEGLAVGKRIHINP